jgi:DNA-binding MarR family transcriptional regulator
MGTESPVTKRYIVDLGVEERARLETIVLKGKHRAQTLTKARILLLADISSAGPGWSDSKIIEALNTNQSTVHRTRKQLVETGEYYKRNMSSFRNQLARAQALLRRFEQEEQLLPQEAERLISEILKACGHEVTDQGFIEIDTGVDCLFQTEIDGHRQRIAVQIKFTQRPLSVSQSIEQAARLKQHPMFDRAIVISRAGFTRAASFSAMVSSRSNPPSFVDRVSLVSKPMPSNVSRRMRSRSRHSTVGNSSGWRAKRLASSRIALRIM